MSTLSANPERMEHRLKAAEAIEADARGAESLELLRQGESLHG